MFCKKVLPFALVLTVAGCSLFTDSIDLQFAYTESAHGQVIEPAFDASGISSGQIVFAGQLNTPNPCYRLVGKLDDDGNNLTLEVSAERTGSTTCEAIVGRFIYEGAIQNLDPGTYDLRVRHSYDVSGWPPKDFNMSIHVR